MPAELDILRPIFTETYTSDCTSGTGAATYVLHESAHEMTWNVPSIPDPLAPCAMGFAAGAGCAYAAGASEKPPPCRHARKELLEEVPCMQTESQSTVTFVQ